MPLETIKLEQFEVLGKGLQRPEDVVVGSDGRVWASDQAAACSEVLPDGSLRRVGKAGGEPNGINMDTEGRIVIANFGTGSLQRLDVESGEVEVLCSEVEGLRLTASNYPIIDSEGTIWCTNSTFAETWTMALDGRADGMLFRVRPDGRAEKMAEGIHFANGLALDRDESHIYVCETSACDVLRYPIRSDGTLGAPERYGPVLGERFSVETPVPADRLGLTDGCGFDVDGNLWVTLVGANRIVAITTAGKVETVVEDPEARVMVQPTNVSWGGPELKDLYIGTIGVDHILRAPSPVAGMPLVHQR